MSLIKCPECGKEYSDKANGCPSCGNPNVAEQENAYSSQASRSNDGQTHKKESKLGIAALIFSLTGPLFFVGLILAIIDLVKNGSERKHRAAKIALIISALWVLYGIFGTEETNESMSNNIQQEETAITDKNIYGVGEQTSRNGIDIVLNGYTESEGNEWGYPKEGNTFVFAEFEIVNNTEEEIIVNSLLSFDIYCDNYKVDFSGSALTANSIDYAQVDGNIAPGKILRGNLGIEVPIDWEQLEIYYKDDSWRNDIVGFVIYK